MNRWICLAFMALCNPFGEVHCNKKYEFHFVKSTKMNNTDDLFKYDLQRVEKFNETGFNVDCEADIFVDLDDEWHMWIQAYHNAEGNEEFGEKPYISLPKKAFCEFMKTSYKERLYPQIKDYSNLPNPDDCPVKANHFVVKDFPFNAGKYAALAKPGMWRIDMFVSQDHEESHVTKMGISIFTSVTQIE